MASKDILIWENLTEKEKAVIKVMSEDSFNNFMKIWFALIQAQKFRTNWHFNYLCWKVEQIING